MLTGDVAAAAAIAGLFALTNAVFNTFKYWKDINWKFVALPLLAYTILSTVALKSIGRISNAGLMRFLGVALILVGLYFLFFQKKVKLKPNKANALLAGSISGVLGSLFAIAGPPIALYYTMLIENNKYQYLGCINAYFLLSNIYVAYLRINSGILGVDEFSYWVMGLLGLFIGRIIGGKMLNKVDGVRIKKIVYAVTIFSGLYYALF